MTGTSDPNFLLWIYILFQFKYFAHTILSWLSTTNDPRFNVCDRADLEIVIYDTKAAVELTKIVLVDASEAQLYSKPYNVVLKGNLVYYSENIHPVSESTLHVIDWTNHNVRKKIILPGTWSDIHCVHKSFVFGTTSRDWNNRYIFAYDLSTGKYLERKKSMVRPI